MFNSVIFAPGATKSSARQGSVELVNTVTSSIRIERNRICHVLSVGWAIGALAEKLFIAANETWSSNEGHRLETGGAYRAKVSRGDHRSS